MKMKNNFFKIQYILFVFIMLFSGCTVIPLVKYFTVKKSEYPRFKKKEYYSAENNAFRYSYDVKFYDLNIDINPNKKYFKGYIDIYFEIEQKQDTLLFDLHNSFKINTIEASSNTIKWFRKKHLLYIV